MVADIDISSSIVLPTELPTANVTSESSVEAKASHGGGMVKFAKADGFMQELKKRVDQYFVETNQTKRDHPRIYVKCFVILAWLTLSYVGLVFLATTWPVALLCSVSLGLAAAAVGFNIQHDGGHGAFSRFPIVNRLTAFTLDILGGSSFIWKRTHNVIHHSYTNVTGIDGDIDLGGLGRLSPHQPHYAFHRLQHIYLWFLYGLITFKWQFYDDTSAIVLGRVGDSKIPRPAGWEVVGLIVGKSAFLILAFAIPLYLHSWQQVALWFCVGSFVQGVMLSIVFQLAHVDEHADFPMPDTDSMRIENAWAVHQVETTIDFAQNHPVVTWYTGGLNYQIEHHLFPQICHIHYPAIARIVEQTAGEFGVKYHAHPTMWSAVKSHFRWLRTMGRQPATPQTATA